MRVKSLKIPSLSYFCLCGLRCNCLCSMTRERGWGVEPNKPTARKLGPPINCPFPFIGWKSIFTSTYHFLTQSCVLDGSFWQTSAYKIQTNQNTYLSSADLIRDHWGILSPFPAGTSMPSRYYKETLDIVRWGKFGYPNFSSRILKLSQSFILRNGGEKAKFMG